MSMFHTFKRGIDPEGRRLLGLTLEGEPLWAPKGHSLLLAANGGGKTTCGCLPWLFSLAASQDRPAILVMDGKNGEIAAQCAPMLLEYGLPVAVIDDMGVLGPEVPGLISLNPLGAVKDAAPQDMVFASENANHALIADPPGGPDRNQFWRDGPRTLIEFCTSSLMTRTPHLAVPGSIWAMLANPLLLKQAAELEAGSGEGMAQILAVNILDMMKTDYYPQHREAAMKSLRIFAIGSRLHMAGADATTTHHDLIRRRAVIFVVGPQAYMARLGSYFALHLASFLGALYRGAGPLAIINDEFTNTPLKPFVDALTTIRGFGGEAHNIAQSRSEIVRKFGKLETETIEENAIIKQWFGFSSFEEAERVSKAMGEAVEIQSSLNVDLKDAEKLSTGRSLGRQRQMSPAELMALPPDEQLIHIKGIGFLRAKKISQNQIAPFCRKLAPNPLEGAVLPPDPRLTLRTPKGDGK